MKTLELKSLKKFKCIGAECPQTCCENFVINVDDNTVSKWQKLENIDNPASKMISFLEKKVLSNVDNYFLKLKSSNRCVMLDEKNLCRAHARYGHDDLPITCQEFPRLSLGNEFAIIKSGALSCPEICNLVLGDDDSQLFNFPYERLLGNVSVSKNDVINKIRFVLAEFTQGLIIKKNLAINIKLYYMSYMIGSFFKIVNSEGYSDALGKELLSQSQSNLNDIKSKIHQGQITVNPITAGSYWKNIFQWSVDRNAEFHWLENKSNDLVGLLELDDESQEHFELIYRKLKPLKYRFDKANGLKLEKLFDKYFIISLVNKGFPLHPKKDHFLIALVYILSVLSLVQLFSWIYFDIHGEISRQDLIQIIYHVEHVAGQTDKVYEHLSQNSHMLNLDRYADVFLDLFSASNE